MVALMLVDNTSDRALILAFAACAFAILACASMLYPEVIAAVYQRAAALVRRLRRRASMLKRDALPASMQNPLSALTWARLRRFVLKAQWIYLIPPSLVFVPTAIAFLWERESPTTAFERNGRYEARPEGAIAALLRGEHLSAPAPLPPAVFTTREVELLRPRLAYASRAWDLLDDAFAQRLLRVYQLMKERHGYDMALIEGYRSPERQTELAAMGTHVTQATAFQSYHQYGLAADSAFVRDGRLVISEKDPWAMQGYRLFGQLAAELGLTWGGNWTLMDFGHVELRDRAGRAARRQAGSR